MTIQKEILIYIEKHKIEIMKIQITAFSIILKIQLYKSDALYNLQYIFTVHLPPHTFQCWV